MSKEQKTLIAKETSFEPLKPEIEKMIEGAKQAELYFKWLLDAVSAIGQLVEHQHRFAKEELEKLEKEKDLKYGQSSN